MTTDNQQSYPTCAACGSRSVQHKAVVSWDYQLQTMVADDWDDEATCYDCSHRAAPEWMVLT